jgi:small conductance mechanosensitive channel
MNEWLTPTFWQGTLERTATWAIAVVPSVLLILILALVGLRILSVTMRRTRKLMVERMKGSRKTDAQEREKRIDTLVGILGSSLRIVLWLMIGMLILRRLGIDIAPLIAGAGIAGLAVGFGAQELVRDVISGFFMLFENQVRSGDVAVVNGTGGLVEHVGLRTIVLRDLSGVVHVFQNGKVNTLSNMTKEWSAMVFDIGVAYKEDTDKVVGVMEQVAEELRADQKLGPQILEPMEIMGVDAFGDSAVVVRGRIKTKPSQQWAVGREYRRRLKKAFDAADIEIPFPHRTVYWGAAINPLGVQVRGRHADEEPAAA